MPTKTSRIIVLFLSLILALSSSSVLSMTPPPASRIGLLASPPAPVLVTKTATPDNQLGTDPATGSPIIAKDSKVTVDIDIGGRNLPVIYTKPVNIVLVADVTGSMSMNDASGQPKITGVKNALNNLVGWVAGQNSIRPADKQLKLALVIYSDRISGGATTTFNFSTNFGSSTDPACAQNALCSSLYGAIKALYANGGTPIGKGLLKARDNFEALKASDPNFNDALNATILYTDGSHNTDIDPTHNNVLDYFRTNKIPIFTIGYGLTSVSDPIDGHEPQPAGPSNLVCNNTSYLVQKTLPSGQIVYYCLVRNGVTSPLKDCGGVYSENSLNPWPNCVALRLNALAYETGGEYYYSPDAESLVDTLLDIIQTISNNSYAIYITEYYDWEYLYFNNDLKVTMPGKELYLLDDPYLWDIAMDYGLLVYNQWGLYLVQPDVCYVGNPCKFSVLLPPNLVRADDTVHLRFSFTAVQNTGSTPRCIDQTNSEIAWGNVEVNNNLPYFVDIVPPKKQSSQKYCYLVASPGGHGDVFFQTSPLTDLKADLTVLGGGTGPIGNWVTLPNYNFELKSGSYYKNFYNDLKNLADYLIRENPGGKIVVLPVGDYALDLSDSNLRSLCLGKTNCLYIKQDSGTLILKNSNTSANIIGFLHLGGGVVQFDNSVSDFYGSVIALPSPGQMIARIELNSVQLNLYGSLIAKNFVKSSISSVVLQPLIPYLVKIPGLTPITDKIYSYYLPK